MKTLDPNEVAFSPSSIVDDAGKVFFHRGRVFRAIYSQEQAGLYSDLLQKKWTGEIFEDGLVRTWIAEDASLDGACLTLEHEAVPFETHPAESTNRMHWLAAKALVKVNLSLAMHGFILKDAHPWNVMFNKGRATVVDFGSIIKSASVPANWLKEFRTYFGAPIWLASTRWKDYSLEYRRQHKYGFGLKLLDSRLFNRTVFRDLNKLEKRLSGPVELFKELDSWLESHKPATHKREYWADYQQCGEELDPLRPELPKQKFVHDILNGNRPAKVLDFAANKGYYSEMAARMGAAVLASDYEEYCVDQCLDLARNKELAITPAVLDFIWPTPSFGMALVGKSSYDRLKSDVVLALGLVHHICITQGVPVEVFCDICMKYADKGVVLEYVDPSDKHVASWNRPTPKNYSIEGITKCFSQKFPKVITGEPITNDGLNRSMVYFGL